MKNLSDSLLFREIYFVAIEFGLCSFNLSEHKQLKTTNQLYLICNFVTNKL